MNIFFRVDGGEEIGFGHIMRTLAIAKELSKNHTVKYICSSSPKYIQGIKKIKKENIDVVKINSENEIEQINRIIGDIIIIDKYNIDYNYLVEIKKRFITVYFDDNAELNFYPVDMIINQNIYGDKLTYNCLPYTKLLLGKDYTIIRDEFRNSNNKNIPENKNIQDIFISLGGSDDSNLMEQIICRLNNLQFNLHIIIGPAFKYKDKLKTYSKDNIFFYENANMSEVMQKCDMAISSCGSILYELIFLGIPTIGIIVADNQINVAKYMNDLGAIRISNISNLVDDILKFKFRDYINMKKIQNKLIDGMGVYRIQQEICKYDK